MTVIQDIENRQRRELPPFKAGDTVKVHFKVIEGNRSRVQVFEGICIKRQGEGVRETFTVRKKSFNEVFVERTFPVHSPRIHPMLREAALWHDTVADFVTDVLLGPDRTS